MISTLLVTVIIEALTVIVYSFWRHKPLAPILLTSVFGNLVTQSILWIVLSYAFPHYLLALSFTEVLIWGIESLFLYGIPANQLKLKEAALLSLGMNGISLTIGLFLPV